MTQSLSNSQENLTSWVKVSKNSDFPIQNLPYGVFEKSTGERHIGVAIGDFILDLYVLASNNYFKNSKYLNNGKCFKSNRLNEFMGLSREAWKEARSILQSLLSSNNSTLQNNTDVLEKQHGLLKQSSVRMVMPCKIGDYTDFYSSKNHAFNVGTMFRGKDNALQPNWLYLPVGYHGRASTVIESGVPIRRPNGQLCPDITKSPPTFGPCKLLDFELELGLFVGGKSNKLGNPLNINDLDNNLFGVVLMNDWSARDIQKWEYIPLGPFNAKNFATSISPWIVTMEALSAFKLPLVKQEPKPLNYLISNNDNLYNIELNVSLQSEKMSKPQIVCKSNAKYLYWSFKQQLAHHTSTGCKFNSGDLLGTGTISGTTPDSYGSMLELSWRGSKPITLSDGTQRKFINNGDKVIMNGKCNNGKYSIGFGTLQTTVLPPIDCTRLGKL